MQEIHENLPTGSFTQPDDSVQVAVCSKSGKLPVEGLCDADPRGSCIITEYFAADNQPTETCDTHVKVNICNDSGLVANAGCTNVSTNIYVKKSSTNTLGSEDTSGYTTADAQYAITDEKLSRLCTLHSTAAPVTPSTTTNNNSNNNSNNSQSTTTKQNTTPQNTTATTTTQNASNSQSTTAKQNTTASTTGSSN